MRRFFFWSVVTISSAGCTTLKDIHQNLESTVTQTTKQFDQYRNSIQGSPACERNPLKSRVVGGTDVSAEDPLSKRVALLVINRKDRTSSCTAAPLSENVLMTAAHCVADAKPDEVRAYFHTSIGCSNGDEQKTMAHAARIEIHPTYDKTPQSKSDLALIKLTTPIPADYRTAGIYDGKSKLTNDEVVFLGYGITDEQKQDSMVLRTTTKSFAKDSFIKDSLIGFNQTSKGGGYCRGDSGAPIYVHTEGSMKIIGVNSFNVGKEKNRECHTASFGMYLPYFKNWILAKTVEL